MTLTTEFERIDLPLETPFTISRGTTETVSNVLIRITDDDEDDGPVGLGAASPSAYYGETAATVEAVLPELLAVVEAVDDPHAGERIERRMRERIGDNPAARCGVAIAVADLAGEQLDLPLYRQFGLDPERAPQTSFTIGLAEPDRMAEKAERAVEAGYEVLKVKLGAGAETDRQRLQAVREAAPEVRLRVDANAAWTPREAVAMSDELADLGVEFCEQPVPADDLDGLCLVRERGAVPVAVDESVETAADAARVASAGAADVIVAKLMKAGSLREVRRIAHVAHAHNCEAMLGCMVSSNAAIAPGWHLAPLFEYVDLDGSLLLAEDPIAGVPLDGGTPDLAGLDRPGTGAHELTR